MKHTYTALIAIILSFISFASFSQSIAGPGTVCNGYSISLAGTPAGGTWTSSNSAIAPVSSTGGVVTGLSAGVTTISYITGSGIATHLVTVNATPGAITGPSMICVGFSGVLSNPTVGGTWSSAASAIISISSAGVATGNALGSANIYYTLPTGCFAIKNMSTNPVPAAISGSLSVPCSGTTTLANATTGGTWSTSTTIVASVGASTGIVTGNTLGTATISYVLGSTGCLATAVVTVSGTVSAGTISGPSTLCVGSSGTLTSTVSGGTWSTAASNISLSSTTGAVTGLSAGVAIATYTYSGSCGTASAVYTINVVTSPSVGPILGSLAVACGSMTTLSDATTGGTWSSSNPAIAVIGSSSGIVTAISAGTANVTYTLAMSCGTASATAVVTVTPTASAGTISGPGTICDGGTGTLSSSVSGGTWSSSSSIIATVGASTGVVTGISVGTVFITYTVTTSCGTAIAVHTLLVTTTSSAGTISGSLSVCPGSTTSLTSSVSGGAWTSMFTSVATIVPGTGIVTGVTAGTSMISYIVSASCGSSITTAIVTVNAAPAAITGTTSLCAGGTTTLMDATTGGTWAITPSSIATISSAGVVSGVAAGSATATYTLPTGCYATAAVTVSSPISVSATASLVSCGSSYLGIATGATSFIWAPATGVTCSTCATTYIDPMATTTYTVTGTTGACTGTTTVTVDGNRIYGHISFSSTMPSALAMKVWLVQFDPTDSSIVATDSMATCLDGGSPFYMFNSKPAGNYLVKAKLLSSVPGTSDYIPTYGASTPYWYLAANIAHAAATNVQDINMIYGTVPAGPGFISGYVVSGAGKGTAGEVPQQGMLIFLKKAATGEIVTYTYTDATGAYSFGSLAYGSYIIAPDEQDYYTTPSTVITLSASAATASAVDFKKYTTSHVIMPFAIPNNIPVCLSAAMKVYPNPAKGVLNIYWGGMNNAAVSVLIKDVTGREVISSLLNLGVNETQSVLDIGSLHAGLYFITIKSGDMQHTEKIVIQD
ncbi:MAG: T9SS type A sorting domain-containing protein [Bacteroidota bacterium]